ncbi:MAG: hypothetical protein H6858_03440 [Rhodospirillales bacterium]|nr:hypothetical protein [Alphaproteobacteria bacterium]MCB1839877.1 hypothetical protein [Alphaproteobacteria bacterium]MCB9976637.1 hypothetical protein [Rhodospirillales bacterium]
MKKSLLLAALILSACAAPRPIPPEIKAKVQAMPQENLPVYASIEQQRCPKSRYPSLETRLDCKHEVRRELAARRIMRELNAGQKP